MHLLPARQARCGPAKCRFQLASLAVPAPRTMAELALAREGSLPRRSDCLPSSPDTGPIRASTASAGPWTTSASGSAPRRTSHSGAGRLIAPESAVWVGGQRRKECAGGGRVRHGAYFGAFAATRARGYASRARGATGDSGTPGWAARARASRGCVCVGQAPRQSAGQRYPPIHVHGGPTLFERVYGSALVLCASPWPPAVPSEPAPHSPRAPTTTAQVGATSATPSRRHALESPPGRAQLAASCAAFALSSATAGTCSSCSCVIRAPASCHARPASCGSCCANERMPRRRCTLARCLHSHGSERPLARSICSEHQDYAPLVEKPRLLWLLHMQRPHPPPLAVRKQAQGEERKHVGATLSAVPQLAPAMIFAKERSVRARGHRLRHKLCRIVPRPHARQRRLDCRRVGRHRAGRESSAASQDYWLLQHQGALCTLRERGGVRQLHHVPYFSAPDVWSLPARSIHTQLPPRSFARGKSTRVIRRDTWKVDMVRAVGNWRGLATCVGRRPILRLGACRRGARSDGPASTAGCKYNSGPPQKRRPHGSAESAAHFNRRMEGTAGASLWRRCRTKVCPWGRACGYLNAQHRD